MRKKDQQPLGREMAILNGVSRAASGPPHIPDISQQVMCGQASMRRSRMGLDSYAGHGQSLSI
jgi:hypothetical protein